MSIKIKPMPRTASDSGSSLDRLVRLVVSNHTPEELALGYLRYEAVRRMSPRTFGELHRLNLSGRFFDGLVDDALKSWKEPNAGVSDRRVHGMETTAGANGGLLH